MSKPSIEVFTESVRKSLRVVCEEREYRLASVLLDGKGPGFHFYEDGGVDSLDMLDVAFYIDKDIGTKLKLEELMHSGEPMTLDNLYNAIREDASTPA